MSKIFINDEKEIEGKLTLTRAIHETESGKVLSINGVLQTKEYFEEIQYIETNMLLIAEVEVLEESFGSEDLEIVYSFRAERMKVKEEGERYE